VAATKKPVRIGNAQAFWGDRGDAAADMLAREPDLDYLTLDYLAEVSMSILAMQRERDPEAGYARDFVDVVQSLAPYWSAGGRCRVIANAGGLNPRACAEACARALADAGCRSMRIGVVTRDDVLDVLRAAGADSRAEEFVNLDTGATIDDVRNCLVTANAYLGAAAIVQALGEGAEIVITGRVADPSLVAAACIHHFGWREDEFDRLAGATVAGHLIECGAQVTGGISTDWLALPDVSHIGFPIVEVADDGNCVVSKPPGTGGCVTPMTVKEQLVYEIGDPGNYLSPDVTVSFLSLAVEDLGDDRVRVSGATGRPRPESYKVSATYRDGFRAAGMLTIIGRDAVAKARRCGELVLECVRYAGFELRDSVIECLGGGDAASGIVGRQVDEPSQFGEVVLRVTVETDTREGAERFSRELMPLITAGPQGTTGYAEGRPRIHPVFRYWPCLIARDAVTPRVAVLSSTETTRAASPVTVHARGSCSSVVQPARATLRSSPLAIGIAAPSRLYDIACARSGDKGTSANVGVIARSRAAWEFLQAWLTSERVADYFSVLGLNAVERFELPNLDALNFILRGALRRSLRTDAQGKALGQILLEMQIPEDAARKIHAVEHSEAR
jgi:hypothetical protein